MHTYSFRRAITGSMRDARRAGTKHARAATPRRIRDTTADSRDIVGPEAVEQRGHRARRDRRQDQANGESGERQRQASSAEGEQYLAGRRA